MNCTMFPGKQLHIPRTHYDVMIDDVYSYTNMESSSLYMIVLLYLATL
jgi:hypothetical protein